MYEITPVSEWGKRTTIMVQDSETIELLWKNNYKGKKKIKPPHIIKKMLHVQTNEFNSFLHSTEFKSRYHNIYKMCDLFVKFIPMIVSERPHFVIKRMEIRKIKKLITRHPAVRAFTNHYLITISERLNSYIQMLSVDENREEFKEFNDLKRFLRYKFSETTLNKQMKRRELEELLEHCKKHFEGDTDVCDSTQRRQT